MTPVKEQLIDIENGELFVNLCGTGPALVLIHGMATDVRLWTPQIDALAAHFQVISYDMRGFGRSSRPEGPYRAEDDLARLLEQLDIPAAHILGLSLGSSVANRFALAYPQRTRSLTVVGPVLQGYVDAEDFMQGLKYIWAVAREHGVDEAKAAWLQLPLFTTLLNSPAWSALGRQMINDYDGWHWQNRDPEVWPEVMPAERLAEITAPTLIIIGDQEIEGLRRIGAFMADKILDATTMTISDAGHIVNLEQPEEFNRAVIDFLTQRRLMSGDGQPA
ncbi:MAG: hypothetical protein DRQ98_10225 [Gammaproteobacteria bacterium]|nr:MAG: hypothetical protein DRQ98_10225 [Gammaproteobacteria bacterium]